MNILTIFITVILVLLSLTTTALIITIKNIIRIRQEMKAVKQRETHYQNYIAQEELINEKLNKKKNEIIAGTDISSLFNRHFMPDNAAANRNTETDTADKAANKND